MTTRRSGGEWCFFAAFVSVVLFGHHLLQDDERPARVRASSS